MSKLENITQHPPPPPPAFFLLLTEVHFDFLRYGGIVLPAIQNFMDQRSITKLPNGTICIKGVPANGQQTNNATNKTNQNITATDDLDHYKYSGPSDQSSHYFAKRFFLILYFNCFCLF
jgi:hypothetical protein